MLRISNLVKDYEVRSEKIRVLDNIDLTVEDGEILGEWNPFSREPWRSMEKL